MTPKLLAWGVRPFIKLENFQRRTGFGGLSEEFGYNTQSWGVYQISGDTVWGAAKCSSSPREWKRSVFTLRFLKFCPKIVEYQIPKKYIKHGYVA